MVIQGSSGTTMGNAIMNKEPSLLLAPIMTFIYNPHGSGVCNGGIMCKPLALKRDFSCECDANFYQNKA